MLHDAAITGGVVCNPGYYHLHCIGLLVHQARLYIIASKLMNIIRLTINHIPNGCRAL